MRLRIVLVVALCLLVTVSVATALDAPPPTPGVTTSTADQAAPVHSVGVGVHVEAGDATVDADVHNGSANVDLQSSTVPDAAVSTPAPGELPTAPCLDECGRGQEAEPDSTSVESGAWQRGQVVREAVEEAPPAFWWSASVLAVGSLASKIWWFGPGRATWLVGKALRWGIAVPLWTRITSGYLMENENRAAILAYVEAQPGASIQEVQQNAGVAWGTAVYHLDRLQRGGKVVGHRSGNHHRYWASGTPEAALRRGWALLEQDTARQVAMAVATSPGVHQGAICELAGVRAPSASKHLSRLERGGLVEKTRVSRYAVYRPTPELEQILAMQAEETVPQVDAVAVRT